MDDRDVALDPHSKLKPIMDNRCSKNHPLYNPTVIHNGKIILSANMRTDMHQASDAANTTMLSFDGSKHLNTGRFKYFTVGSKTNKIVARTAKDDKEYYK